MKTNYTSGGSSGAKGIVHYAINDIFENVLWEWLMFGCIALIAFVETLSAIKQLLEWKKDVYPFICSDDNSSQGSRK